MKCLHTLCLGAALLLACADRVHAQDEPVLHADRAIPLPAAVPHDSAGAASAAVFGQPVPDALSVPSASVPPAIAARERQLTRDLTSLRDSNPYRVWLGVTVLTIGAATVGLGVAYPHELGPFFIPLGATALVRGILGFALLPNPRPTTERYLRLPTFTPAQMQTRIHYGEATLAYLAKRARAARLIDGSLSLVLAASYTPLAWWLERRTHPEDRFGDRGEDYAVLALSIVAVANALVSLLSESFPEERYQAYRALLAQQTDEAPTQQAPAPLSLNLSFRPTQLALQATLRL